MQVLMQLSESRASIEEFPGGIKPYFNFKEQLFAMTEFCSMAKS
jgi:hypothetical protein